MEYKLRKRELTEKQINLRDFLLIKLGFSEPEYRNKFAELLTEYFYKRDYTKEVTFNDKTTGNPVYAIVHFNVIDALTHEIQFKEEKKWVLKNKYFSSKATSATELSAFEFCPASFSISNTFETETTIAMEIGTGQHEESILSAFKKDHFKNFTEISKKVSNSTEQPEFINEENRYFFEDIQNSTLIFSGHKENCNQLFYNNKKDFVGQPDYIFKNNNGKNFIVEEKFKQNDNDKSYLFSNHKVQLISYLYGLEELNAEYGYLVYWYYSYQNYSIKIGKCKVYKITKSKVAEDYFIEVFDKVNILKSGKKLEFDLSKLSPNKCINCSFNKWCGHKTGLYKDLFFPYQTRFLNTFIAKYNQSDRRELTELSNFESEFEVHIEANWACLEHSGIYELSFYETLTQEEKDNIDSGLDFEEWEEFENIEALWICLADTAQEELKFLNEIEDEEIIFLLNYCESEDCDFYDYWDCDFEATIACMDDSALQELAFFNNLDEEDLIILETPTLCPVP